MKNNYITQTQFSEKLGVSQPYISKLVGENKLSTNANNKINDITGFIEYMISKFDNLSDKHQSSITQLIQQIKEVRNTMTLEMNLTEQSRNAYSDGDNLEGVPKHLQASFKLAMNNINAQSPTRRPPTTPPQKTNQPVQAEIDGLSPQMLKAFTDVYNKGRK